MRNGDVYCIKAEFMAICRPEKRKRVSWLPKWWCFNCKKYVLPDRKYHKIWFDKPK